MTIQEAIEVLEGLAVPIHAECAFDIAIHGLKAWRDVIDDITAEQLNALFNKDEHYASVCDNLIGIISKHLNGVEI